MSLFQLKEKDKNRHDDDDDVLLEREITLAEPFKFSTEAFWVILVSIASFGVVVGVLEDRYFSKYRLFRRFLLPLLGQQIAF